MSVELAASAKGLFSRVFLKTTSAKHVISKVVKVVELHATDSLELIYNGEKVLTNE